MAKVKPRSTSPKRTRPAQSSGTALRRPAGKTRAKRKAPPVDKAHVASARSLSKLRAASAQALQAHVAAAMPGVLKAAAAGGEAAGVRALRKATTAAARAYRAKVGKGVALEAARSIEGHVLASLGVQTPLGRAGATWRAQAARRVGAWGAADASALQSKLRAAVRAAAKLGPDASAADLRRQETRARKVVQSQVEIARRRAANAAVDEVGNLAAVASRTAAKDRGEDEYIWRTMNDDRVRDEHAALEGTVRKWSESPLPGEPPNCRCVAEPVPTAAAA
jgi:SPP1 gp7 family putative phage head morphogenesis protein